jgi:DNA repair protein RecN (Recombination protein N)
MLRRLTIRHFAIVDSLSLDLDEGLSVLTGETGAGKSIIVGALNLVLGGRALSEVVRTGCDSAEVSALFDRPADPAINRMLDDLGLTPDETELLFRRQVFIEGRSRAWLNDRPITVMVLGDIAGRLVDISGQHQHQSLLRVDNHLLLLDRFGELDGRRAEVGARYERLRALEHERRALLDGIARRQERSDFLRFQLDELEKAQVKPDEELDLERERGLLRHAEAIREGLSESQSRLSGEAAAVAACVRAERALGATTRYLPEAEGLVKRLESARLELEDIGHTLSGLLRKTDSNPRRLDDIESRLALLARLLRKHGPTTRDLSAKRDAMRAELEKLEHGDEALTALSRQVTAASAHVLEAARILSQERLLAAQKLSKAIIAELNDLGMPKTQFSVTVEPRLETGEDGLSTDGVVVGPNGIDLIEFRFSPNPGEALKSLARIASGGELSRVMLAIKCVLLEHDPVSLSVFDEVDSGIGGSVAQKVGEKIRDLSGARQVICITHLPQIAAYGDRHFLVSKSSRKGRTFSQVDVLAAESAVFEELARMMAGEALGEAALNAARDLREHARRSFRQVRAG